MDVTELSQVLRNSLNIENYLNIELNFTGNTEKYDNHMSDVSFLTVNCETESGEKKKLHLVMKKGKESLLTRNLLKIRSVFMQEINLYETIFPRFMKFQEDRVLKKNIFYPLPKNYKSVIFKSTEFILLANLKAEGYRLWPRNQPLNGKHLELCLKNYAKLHALSLAMRDQQRLQYENTVKDLEDVMESHLKGPMYYLLGPLFDQVTELLEKRKMSDLCSKLKQLLDEEFIVNKALKLILEGTDYSIVNHGDAWINNFLFLYQVNCYYFEIIFLINHIIASVHL